jgi:hypothetical protein
MDLLLIGGGIFLGASLVESALARGHRLTVFAPPIAAVLLDSVPSALAGTASGVFNTSRQVGGASRVPYSARC